VLLVDFVPVIAISVVVAAIVVVVVVVAVIALVGVDTTVATVVQRIRWPSKNKRIIFAAIFSTY
jgi:hypothetical protein